MMRFVRLIVVLSIAVFLLGCGGSASDGEAGTPAFASQVPPDSVKQRVEREIEALNQMRESLASTIDTPAVDKATFKRVCTDPWERT